MLMFHRKSARQPAMPGVFQRNAEKRFRGISKGVRRHPALVRGLALGLLVLVVDGCFAACSAGGQESVVLSSEEGSLAGTLPAAGVSVSAAADSIPADQAASGGDTAVTAGSPEEMTGTTAPADSAGTAAAGAPEESGRIYVDVAGAVMSPGVYVLQEGSRIFEAIAAAGGATEEAAVSALNQAAVLADGMQLYVPTKEEAASGKAGSGSGSNAGGTGSAAGTSSSSAGSSWLSGGGAAEAGTVGEADGRVNINTADAAGLETLNGIGAQKAEAIIAYREANGRFEKIEDIMKVSGIKQAGFDKIKDSITVE